MVISMMMMLIIGFQPMTINEPPTIHIKRFEKHKKVYLLKDIKSGKIFKSPEPYEQNCKLIKSCKLKKRW